MKVKALFAAAALSATVFAATPAANAALKDCGTDSMCLWGNNDFKYMLTERGAGSSTVVNLTGDDNNEMDSWANRSASYTGCGYGSANGAGDKQTFARNSDDNNVAPWNSDEISSWRTKYGC